MTSTNLTATVSCPKPFLNGWTFASHGGDVRGRFCGEFSGQSSQKCCLPCPIPQWMYDDAFPQSVDRLGYIGLVSLVSCVVLLLSNILVAPKRNGSLWLNVGLIISGLCVALSFTIPIPGSAPVCLDDITPLDSTSSTGCATTGVLFQAGLLSTAIFVLMDVLHLHLAAFWRHRTGTSFLLASLCFGILVPAILAGVTMGTSGYSYRIGHICMIKKDNHGLALFWAWLMACGSLVLVALLVTLLYAAILWRRCGNSRKTQPKSRFVGYPIQERGVADKDELQINVSAGLEQDTDISADSTVGDWVSTRHMLSTHWRHIVFAPAVSLELIFIAVVSWQEDKHSNNGSQLFRVQEFMDCLIRRNGNKAFCTSEARYLVKDKSKFLAAMTFAAIIGLECLLLLTTKELFHGLVEASKHPRIFFNQRFSRAANRLSHLRSARWSDEIPLQSTSPVRFEYQREQRSFSRVGSISKPCRELDDQPGNEIETIPEHAEMEVTSADTHQEDERPIELASSPISITPLRPPTSQLPPTPSPRLKASSQSLNLRKLSLKAESNPSTENATTWLDRPVTPPRRPSQPMRSGSVSSQKSATLPFGMSNGLNLSPASFFAERPTTPSSRTSSPSRPPPLFNAGQPLASSTTLQSPLNRGNLDAEESRSSLSLGANPSLRLSRFIEDFADLSSVSQDPVDMDAGGNSVQTSAVISEARHETVDAGSRGPAEDHVIDAEGTAQRQGDGVITAPSQVKATGDAIKDDENETEDKAESRDTTQRGNGTEGKDGQVRYSKIGLAV